MSAPKNNPCDVTDDNFQFQTTAALPISQFKRTQRGLPLYNPFTDYVNQIQNSSTVTNQSIRSIDKTFMMNKSSTIVKTLRGSAEIG